MSALLDGADDAADGNALETGTEARMASGDVAGAAEFRYRQTPLFQSTGLSDGNL